MNRRALLPLVAAIVFCFGSIPVVAAEPQAPHGFVVQPAEVTLHGNFAQAQLLATAIAADGKFGERTDDLTRVAKFVSSDPKIVTVENGGKLLAIANGTATITATFGSHTKSVPVQVSGIDPAVPIDFMTEIMPIISKAGCNAGACHASQYGKGGFKLSVFGLEPSADWAMIVRDRTGRRANLLEPAKSLVLLKPTLGVAHSGGKRLQPGSADCKILESWLLSGAPAPKKEAPKVVDLKVVPERRVGTAGMIQQLQVIATYSDKTQRDVTHWARFDSMDDGVCVVSPEGLVTCIGRGQGPVLIRFEGQARVAMHVVPYSDKVELKDWKDNNYVDTLAAAKFRELGIEPSGLCDDATFQRRAFLDATGSLPTVEETRKFLADNDPAKRSKLVDRLLGLTGDPTQDIYNDRYASLWTQRWSDLIRTSSRALGEQGMWAMHNWIKDAFRSNKHFDQFAKEIITAKGSLFSNGPANYFRVANNPPDLAEGTAQLFLGIRLQCAKCHQHPFEKFSQADYYGFAAFFARVSNKNSSEFGLFGGESVVMVRSTGEVSHPRTGQVLKPTPLEGEPVDDPLDRRRALADWLTSSSNRFFARNVANRYADYLLGRPFVAPVDDLRDTNPASNEALLAAMSEDFIKHKFDLKQLIRTIMNSRLYQLSSQPTKENRTAGRFYASYQVKRLPAEVLLDAIDDITEVRTKHRNLPLGTRAIDLPDGEYPDYFLKTFGKPKRAINCECERVRDENLAQALHMLNGDMLAGKISDGNGRIARLMKANKPPQEIVDDLFLATFGRLPTDGERVAADKLQTESDSPKSFYEDLLWSLFNSKQFLFVH